METQRHHHEFQERAVRAIRERFAVPGPIADLSRLVIEQEAASRAASIAALSPEARRLRANFERDRKVLADQVSPALQALHDQWRPTHDGAPRALRDRLHFFGADRLGTGRPGVYTLSWGHIDGGGGGAGIGVRTSLGDGTFSAEHSTHGSNNLSAYAGIGVSLIPSLDVCQLSVRPVVDWRGFDILSHRIFDTKLSPSGWGVAAAKIGLIVQSWDLAGNGLRTDGSRWVDVWRRNEVNPSGFRYYDGDSVDARSLLLEVLATSQRQYAIWVSCRAEVITQAQFDLDISASASVTCQLPYLAVEEVPF
jgi:hypothetical protein